MQTVQFLPSYEEITVYYPGTDNSGSAVAADVAVGDTVTMKDAAESEGTLSVCRPETATLENTKFLVTSVPAIVNTISTGTTRTGGYIKVIPWKSITGFVDANVADGVAAGDALVVTNGVFSLSASTSVASVAALAAYVAYARVANSSGAIASRRVQAGVFN